MAVTTIYRNSELLSFDRLQALLATARSTLPSFDDLAILAEAGGLFEISANGEVPEAPPDGTLENIWHFSFYGVLKPKWDRVQQALAHLSRLASDPRLRGAEVVAPIFFRVPDPVTGIRATVWVDLPLEEFSSVGLRTTGFSIAECARFLEAFLPLLTPIGPVKTDDKAIEIMVGDTRSVFQPGAGLGIGGTIPVGDTLADCVTKLAAALQHFPAARGVELTWNVFFIGGAPLTPDEHLAMWRFLRHEAVPVDRVTVRIDFSLRELAGLEAFRVGCRRKKGLVVEVGQFGSDEFGKTLLVARATSEGYRMEIHTKAPDEEDVQRASAALGLEFKDVCAPRR